MTQRAPADTGGGELEAVFRERQAFLIHFLMHRLGCAAEAQDVAQAVFLKLWQRRGELTGENLGSLLFVTARNMAVDVLRSRRTGRLAMLHQTAKAEATLRDDAPSAERVLLGQDQLAQVRRLIDELPQKCRRAFLEYKIEGRAYGEIALRMGITESMVRKYVRRAIVHCAARHALMEGWE